MWPYAVLIFLPMVVHHIKLKNSGSLIRINDRNKAAMKLFWLLLFILLILRQITVGTDLLNYKRIFSTIMFSSWKDAVFRSPEIGFNVLMKTIANISGEFRLFLIVCAILSICFLAAGYIKYSEDTSLSIAIFISTSTFLMLFSGLKQAIAISLGFFAFEMARKRRLIIFIAVVLIAMSFHPSAFMLFFMYPLYFAKLTKKWIPGIVFALVTIFVFNEQIFRYLTRLLLMFTEYEGTISKTGAYTMLILFGLFSIFSYVIPDESKMDNDTLGMRNFLLLAFALQMFAPLNSLAMRMGYYYMAFIPIVIPRIINRKRYRWNQVAVFVEYLMIVFFSIYFFVSAEDNNVLSTFPYRFFWEETLL
ncbi:MAG: EpsG family protein [Oscillospiraceae bacterium]|nr:EpsG family protein [Oscillospiraceae bacterium]